MTLLLIFRFRDRRTTDPHSHCSGEGHRRTGWRYKLKIDHCDETPFSWASPTLFSHFRCRTKQACSPVNLLLIWVIYHYWPVNCGTMEWGKWLWQRRRIGRFPHSIVPHNILSFRVKLAMCVWCVTEWISGSLSNKFIANLAHLYPIIKNKNRILLPLLYGNWNGLLSILFNCPSSTLKTDIFKMQDYFISSEKLKCGWTLTTSQYTIIHI